MENKILIHLHPDFSIELAEVLERWNSVQKRLQFIGLRPKHDDEIKLLEQGSIHENSASDIANEIRTKAGYKNADGIIVFSEKRIYADDVYQLFVGGKERDEKPPAIAILSLHFLRIMYEDSKSPNMFRAIVSNILFSVGIDYNLGHEDDRTGSCIMDYCEYLPDIHKGLENGPCFCPECVGEIKRNGDVFLLQLTDSFLNIINIDKKDKHVTELINARKEYNDIEVDDFRYDIALSFSGKDREYAEDLAIKLRDEGIAVFYDKFEKAKLLGMNLQVYLTNLYRLKAKYCVFFSSKNYLESPWAIKVELKAMLSRAFQGNEDYIIPIRLDNTEIPGILPEVCYIDWYHESVASISKLLIEKLDDDSTTPEFS